MDIYKNNIEKLIDESKKLASTDRRLSTIRLLTILSAAFLAYKHLQTEELGFLIAGALSTISFFLIVKKHGFIRWTLELVKAKLKINQDELSFLTKGELSFYNGEEFKKHDHPYSYDLDFFGENSLYQTLNRTATTNGKKILAKNLLHILSEKEILQTQEAVKELSQNLEWRQHILALGRLKPDSLESNNELHDWAKKKPRKFNPIIRVLTFLLPILTIGAVGLYFIYQDGLFGNIAGLLLLLNLGFLASHMLWIKEELTPTTKIEGILKQYSMLLKAIENQTFRADKLKDLQTQLTTNRTKSSEAIHQLSLLFGRLEHVTNIFASPLLNGAIQYHLHVLHALSKWRSKHATHLEGWLKVIGEIEAISSLANFSYNNPDFVFPKINQAKHIQFENLGHPLIAKEKSITNSIDFDKHSFFILTGSNMSGKSTFLRTLGVNMVLSSIGAPVYASKADVHPMPVFVSMRLSDSLTDSESYFYAEVKRLKSIMDQLDREQCFVLLDEILRGTNSDDKRNGTIEVIRKMVEKKAYGGIATHDLEVCNVAEEFPKTLSNKRFEVEIVNDELVFDYKLQEGICENKSASFIMKKMGVI